MPSHSKSNVNNPKSKQEPPADYTDFDNILADQDITTRGSRKKSRNAATKPNVPVSISETVPEVDTVRERSPSPIRPQSILGQLPQAFVNRKKDGDTDLLGDLNVTEKVSDEHTPPQESWISKGLQLQSTSDAKPAASVGAASSPPFQQSYAGKGGFNSTRSPPTSPPQAKARPISYSGPSPSYTLNARISTSPYGYTGNTYGSPPALPHLPQQHFYSAHDVDVGTGPTGLPAKQMQRNFIKLAYLPGAGRDPRELILTGTDGRLDILSYDGVKLDQIGYVRNLPGIVLDAAFLTWSDGFDPFEEFRPLVAITSYGPKVGVTDENGQPPSWIPTANEDTQHGWHSHSSEQHLETSVIIYSLSRHCPISVLLRAPAIPPQHSHMLPTFQRTLSAHRLRLQASGNYLIVSSGISGEVYAFGIQQGPTEARFELLGKFWTSIQPRVQRRDSSHGRASDADVSPADINRGPLEEELPIVNLSGRWLAFCPADSPSRPSIGAVIGPSVLLRKSANVASTSAPSRPSVNCEVQSPDVDTFLGKVARGVAQEFLKGSKWLGEKGIQTFQNYWKRDATSPISTPANPYTSPAAISQLGLNQFPPTHADPSNVVSKEPELITILDLKSMHTKDGKRQADSLISLATFQPPAGCSFLSFTPVGLNLLTASRKGDIYYIWDLMQLRYPRATIPLSDTDTGRTLGCVRQVAKYARLSPSTIVDIAWELPNSNRFAVLTQNRTIHIFDLPANVAKWPPSRASQRSRPDSTSLESPAATSQYDTSSYSGILASAMSLAGRTQPILTNLRGRAPSMSGGFSGIGATGIGIASATGVRGGKAVAAGLSKSLGAASDTMAQIRHAGQSKLHLRIDPIAGRLLWRWHNSRLVLAVLDPTGIRNYYVRKTKPRDNRQIDSVSVFDARKAVAVKFPNLQDFQQELKYAADNLGDQSEQEKTSGFWKPRIGQKLADVTNLPPLSYAEIETNAPYQPFHSDHRITLSVFTNGNNMSESQLPTASLIVRQQTPRLRTTQTDQWIFGNEIPISRVSTGYTGHDAGRKDEYGSVIYRQTSLAPSTEDGGLEQIVSTTRRRRNKKQTDGQPEDPEDRDQDGFFEDDCDVLDFATDRV